MIHDSHQTFLSAQDLIQLVDPPSNTPMKPSVALEDQMSFNVDLCDIDVDGPWVSRPNRLK